jgi:hypothetical protein
VISPKYPGQYSIQQDISPAEIERLFDADKARQRQDRLKRLRESS